jgi:hypothetical protein
MKIFFTEAQRNIAVNHLIETISMLMKQSQMRSYCADCGGNHIVQYEVGDLSAMAEEAHLRAELQSPNEQA